MPGGGPGGMRRSIDSTARRGRVQEWAATAAACAAAALAALWQYRIFLQDPRARWQELVADRSGHYEFALDLALALRAADLSGYFATLWKAMLWPPLHGSLAAIALAIGGPDYRLAVLPSLAGWALTAVAAFLLARRLSPACGIGAGALALAMVLASPAHRVFATDIMLESLGAGLTMLAAYLYVRARQEGGVASWRWLGLALTALFFEKYSYWMLAVLALAASAVWEHRHAVAGRARSFPWRGWLHRQLRDKLNYAVVVAAALPLAILAVRPGPISIAGRSVGLYPPGNLTTLAFAVLMLRLWRDRRAILQGLTPAARQLFWWHGLPVALSLLLPRRLSGMIAYLSPSAHEAGRDPVAAALFYVQAAAADYHAGWVHAAVAAAALILGAVTARWWRPGGALVWWMLALSALLAVLHPLQLSRGLHSWVALAWVAGAVGLASLLHAAPGRAALRAAAFAGLVAIAVLAQVPAMLAPGRSPEVGHRPASGSLLDLSDRYLPALSGFGRVAIFAPAPMKSFIRWTHAERYGRDGLVWPADTRSLTPETAGERVAAWLATGAADAVLVFDLARPAGVSADHWQAPVLDRIVETVDAAPEFRRAQEWAVPHPGGRILLWVRVPAAASPLRRALRGCGGWRWPGRRSPSPARRVRRWRRWRSRPAA